MSSSAGQIQTLNGKIVMSEKQAAEWEGVDVYQDASVADADLNAQDLDVTPPVVMPKRPPMDDEMDITPMIDMTFLLLIFFILTSKMTAEPTYPLPAARNGNSVSVKNCVVITVRAGSGDTAVVSRADGTVFSDDPEQQAAEIGEYIQLGLNTQKSEVLIRAEGAVRNGEISRLKDAVSESLEEGQMINFGVLDEK